MKLCGWLLLMVITLPAAAAAPRDAVDVERLALTLMPEADRVGPFGDEPPAAGVYKDDRLLGYALLTDDVVSIPAYSGKPIRTLVVFDVEGVIQGLRIVKHEEPILVIGVKPTDLDAFVDQYRGLSFKQRVKLGGRPREGYVTLDGISGATITAIVLNASILRSVKAVAQSRGLPRSEGDSREDSPGTGDKISEPGIASGTGAEPADDPLWRATWVSRTPEIIGLLIGLALLVFILLWQDWLAQRPRLLLGLRWGFLSFTLFYLGWYAMAQLSVVNVLTFIGAVVHDFSWESFLIDPVLFILWGFVAVALLLWGRGVYCGWLCPFGALQEFMHRIGRWLKVPTFEFPAVVHDRLWALKYVIFILLFGLSLQSLDAALPYAEVEPFKTVFALNFQRHWPFVVYALALILLAMANRKFFCKYLCPLGAALAIPANLKLFDWLRRRKECGRPCQVCAEECEVRAIRHTGEINHHECHYCLDCQITYYNDHKCPPLVEKRRRRERGRRAAEVAPPKP